MSFRFDQANKKKSVICTLNFLLTCNLDIAKTYRVFTDILSFISILRSLYEDETCKRDLILYNNKEILIGGKPFF